MRISLLWTIECKLMDDDFAFEMFFLFDDFNVHVHVCTLYDGHIVHLECDHDKTTLLQYAHVHL